MTEPNLDDDDYYINGESQGMCVTILILQLILGAATVKGMLLGHSFQ
jgi:hypothetical protein